jgi:hypothetical protein
MLPQHRALFVGLRVRSATKLGKPRRGHSTSPPGSLYGIVSHRLLLEGPVCSHLRSLHSGGHYIKAEEIFYISQYGRIPPEESPDLA